LPHWPACMWTISRIACSCCFDEEGGLRLAG
jgi:hypothetical protein